MDRTKSKSEAYRQFAQDYPVVLTLPVQWGDMDALQHVNNVVYLRWFESARIDYLNRIGFLEQMQTLQQGPILASSSIRYRLPIEFPDQVYIGVRAKQYQSSELVQEYGVFSKAKQAVTTVGEARMVMYDFAAGAKVDIPELILERIRQLEA